MVLFLFGMALNEYWGRVFLLKEMSGRRDGLIGIDVWTVMGMFEEIEGLYEYRWEVLVDEREVRCVEQDLGHVLMSMRYEVDEAVRSTVVGAVEDLVITVDMLISGWFQRLGWKDQGFDVW